MSGYGFLRARSSAIPTKRGFVAPNLLYYCCIRLHPPAVAHQQNVCYLIWSEYSFGRVCFSFLFESTCAFLFLIFFFCYIRQTKQGRHCSSLYEVFFSNPPPSTSFTKNAGYRLPGTVTPQTKATQTSKQLFLPWLFSLSQQQQLLRTYLQT